MGHRHLFFSSQTSDMDRGIWNHPYPDPQLHLDIAAVGGVNPLPYYDVSLRSNNVPSSNLSVEYPNHMAANPGASQNLYMHSSSSSSSDRMLPEYVQTGPSSYNYFSAGHGSISVSPQMEYGRAQFKRKNSAISMGVDRENSNVYYGTGSSSSFSVPPSNLQANPTSGPQYRAWDPVSMPHNHRSNNLSTVAEGFHRNVRSRQSHALCLEHNPIGAHPSSNLSHHPPSTNISAVTAGRHWGNAPASLESHQRGHAPASLESHQRGHAPALLGPGRLNHEMNQFVAGSSSTNHNMELDVGYTPNPLHGRSMSTPLPTVQGRPSQVMNVGHNGYGQRTTPYSGPSSYQQVGFASTLEDGRRPGMEAIPLSRHSRPVSIIGRSNERNGRSRTIYDRFQPFSDGDGAHSRWVSEGASLMDRSSIYDPRNLFDQHRDMRLDIDSMSYEELLALEERIGSVSTGLSENTISTCLTESAYYSSDQDQDEGNCVICLEEYKDRDSLGRLNCGHDFHSSCIKKWLLIKNVCPICKGAALPDSLKEK